MNLYGATLYIQFNSDHPTIKLFMNHSHPEFAKIPKNLTPVKEFINQKYETLVPIEFRYTVYSETFELMGVLKHYKDTVPLLLELTTMLRCLGYEAFISFGFGKVLIPNNSVENQNIEELLHLMTGHGVYSAFQVFKRPELNQERHLYYFYGYHYDCKNINLPIKQIQKNKKTIQNELSELQSIDELTQRETYYLK